MISLRKARDSSLNDREDNAGGNSNFESQRGPRVNPQDYNLANEEALKKKLKK